MQNEPSDFPLDVRRRPLRMTQSHARLDELGGGPAQRVKRVQFLLRSHLAESERFVVEKGRIHAPNLSHVGKDG